MPKFNWRFQGNEKKYLDEVLIAGFKAGSDGAFSTRLESLFAKKHRVPYAIGFNSGTTTMHAALLAMGCGRGDEVLTPALTPLMCGLAPYYTGAVPVFVDVDQETFLMDPKDLESKITKKTKVILVTHMYGGVCNMTEIMKIAKKYKLKVLEDCAQCHLGRDDKNRIAGTIGDVGSWSFENSKQLTCGDGGIITCKNKKLATDIRKLGGLGFKNLTAKSGRVRIDRDKLQNPNWDRFEIIGFNYRMNQMAAAVALAQTERAEKFINLRRQMGLAYTKELHDSEFLTPQKVLPGYFHTYYTFSARYIGDSKGVSWTTFRKKYISLGGDGIYAASKLQHQEPAFKNNNIGKGKTPVAIKLQKSLMNFTTNQSSKKERAIQITALKKTLKYFGENQ